MSHRRLYHKLYALEDVASSARRRRLETMTDDELDAYDARMRPELSAAFDAMTNDELEMVQRDCWSEAQVIWRFYPRRRTTE